MLTRCPTYSSASAQEEGGSTVGHVPASYTCFGSLWTVTLKGISPIIRQLTVPRLLDAVVCILWCYLQCRGDAQETLLLLQHLPTTRVCLCQGCCKWFQLQAVFAVSLFLVSLPQMLDFKSTESCWPSVWFSWSFCQQGNRDGSLLSVGGEITPAATNEVAWQAFYFCLPVFQCLYTKHECFVNILIKDSSGFVFFPPSWGRRMLTKGVSILKFCVEI